MTKLKSILCVNLGLYMDLRTEIEIEVPAGLKNEELVKYIHEKYHGLLSGKKVGEKFDEYAPPQIKEEPVYLRYKKDMSRVYFAGNKDIKETEKQSAELGTIDQLPEDEGGIS